MGKIFWGLLMCFLLSGCNRQEKEREKSAEEIVYGMASNEVNR